jgi:hypothetical protein
MLPVNFGPGSRQVARLCTRVAPRVEYCGGTALDARERRRPTGSTVLGERATGCLDVWLRRLTWQHSGAVVLGGCGPETASVSKSLFESLPHDTKTLGGRAMLEACVPEDGSSYR